MPALAVLVHGTDFRVDPGLGFARTGQLPRHRDVFDAGIAAALAAVVILSGDLQPAARGDPGGVVADAPAGVQFEIAARGDVAGGAGAGFHQALAGEVAVALDDLRAGVVVGRAGIVDDVTAPGTVAGCADPVVPVVDGGQHFVADVIDIVPADLLVECLLLRDLAAGELGGGPVVEVLQARALDVGQCGPGFVEATLRSPRILLLRGERVGFHLDHAASVVQSIRGDPHVAFGLDASGHVLQHGHAAVFGTAGDAQVAAAEQFAVEIGKTLGDAQVEGRGRTDEAFAVVDRRLPRAEVAAIGQGVGFDADGIAHDVAGVGQVACGHHHRVAFQARATLVVEHTGHVDPGQPGTLGVAGVDHALVGEVGGGDRQFTRRLQGALVGQGAGDGQIQQSIAFEALAVRVGEVAVDVHVQPLDTVQAAQSRQSGQVRMKDVGGHFASFDVQPRRGQPDGSRLQAPALAVVYPRQFDPRGISGAELPACVVQRAFVVPVAQVARGEDAAAGVVQMPGVEPQIALRDQRAVLVVDGVGVDDRIAVPRADRAAPVVQRRGGEGQCRAVGDTARQQLSAGIADARGGQGGEVGRVDDALRIVERATRREREPAIALDEPTVAVRRVATGGDRQIPAGKDRASGIVQGAQRQIRIALGADQSGIGVVQTSFHRHGKPRLAASLDK